MRKTIRNVLKKDLRATSQIRRQWKGVGFERGLDDPDCLQAALLRISSLMSERKEPEKIPDGQDPIALNCKVVWTNKYGKENKHLPRGMGVKLVEVSPEARKRLEKFFYLNDNKELSSEYWRMSIVN